MKTLIIDNYDSFTFNLFQLVGKLKGNPLVYKNNEIRIDEIAQIAPTHLIISPGPGTVENKEDFGICLEIIKKFYKRIPILGVCLGHQGIAYAFGGKITKAPHPVHGKQSIIRHKNGKLFEKIPPTFKVMRYHSLIVSKENFPNEFVITAEEPEEKIMMAFEHLKYPLFGIQFHPESFKTECGEQIMKNFLGISS